MTGRRFGAIHLRPAREEDIAFLLELRALTMGPHQRAAGVSQGGAEMGERVRLHLDGASIVEVVGEPVGMMKVLREQARWRLLQLQITPSHQRTGLGTALVRRLLQEAREAGAAVSLSVLKVNHARRLFERLGFAVVSENSDSHQMENGG